MTKQFLIVVAILAQSFRTHAQTPAAPQQQPGDPLTAAEEKLQPALAQFQSQAPAPPSGGAKITAEVREVLLHVTVRDADQTLVPRLPQNHFRVFEDKTEQTILSFKNEDVPVCVGLVVDNSASMSRADKRAKVNAAALAFVEESNPEDEMFVAHFSDEWYIDTESPGTEDFVSDREIMKKALETGTPRGNTSFYDAVIGSAKHFEKHEDRYRNSHGGQKPKNALLLITDGEDTNSYASLEQAAKSVRDSGVLAYTVGVFGDDDKKEAKRAKKALEQISEAGGGTAFFPKELDAVEKVTRQIAQEIRSQYELSYSPSNTNMDGKFRKIRVEVKNFGHGKLSAQTRNGYFATPAP